MGVALPHGQVARGATWVNVQRMEECRLLIFRDDERLAMLHANTVMLIHVLIPRMSDRLREQRLQAGRKYLTIRPKYPKRCEESGNAGHRLILSKSYVYRAVQ
jgi:hypothetical protein